MTELARGVGHGEAEVPAGGSHDARRRHVGREHLVERSSRLERPRVLHQLELEDERHLHAERARSGLQDRRRTDVAGDPSARRLDVGAHHDRRVAGELGRHRTSRNNVRTSSSGHRVDVQPALLHGGGEPLVAFGEAADRPPQRALAVHAELARDRHRREQDVADLLLRVRRRRRPRSPTRARRPLPGARRARSPASATRTPSRPRVAAPSPRARARAASRGCRPRSASAHPCSSALSRSQFTSTSSAPLTSTSPNTCGCRWISFSTSPRRRRRRPTGRRRPRSARGT